MALGQVWHPTLLLGHYAYARNCLCPLFLPGLCWNLQHLFCINQYYNIISDLHSAALGSVFRVPCKTLKPFWDEELDRFKNDSIFGSALGASSGTVQRIKWACKLKYKSAIKDAYVAFENMHNDELFNHFIKKNPSQFWKSCNAKFRENIKKQVCFNDCKNDVDMANTFAKHFSNAYYNSASDFNAVDDFLTYMLNLTLN